MYASIAALILNKKDPLFKVGVLTCTSLVEEPSYSESIVIYHEYDHSAQGSRKKSSFFSDPDTKALHTTKKITFLQLKSSVMYSRPIMQNIDFKKGHIVHIFYSNFEINHVMKIKHVKNV